MRLGQFCPCCSGILRLFERQAYMLYNGSGGSGAGGSADPYKTAVIDTIVAEVQSVPGEDRCVLLLVSTSPLVFIALAYKLLRDISEYTA